MRILMLNQTWFAEDLRQLGHQVITCGYKEVFDLHLKGFIELDDILKEIGEPIDRILIHDLSQPILVAGLADTSIPTLFYAVDTHQHRDLHCALAHVFDHVFVAHKDYVELLADEDAARASWLPLYASILAEPCEAKSHEAVFVGWMNQERNPERSKFFDALGKEVPLLVTTGRWEEIYPRAKVVINQTAKGDLNFRVFEALGSGSALVTERTKNGLTELFEEGTHYLGYDRGSVPQAKEAILTLLQDETLQKRIGEAGRAAVVAAHTSKHRAEAVLSVLESLPRTTDQKRYFAWMINWGFAAHQLGAASGEQFMLCLLYAYQAALKAFQLGETFDPRFSAVLQIVTSEMDRLKGSTEGATLAKKILATI